MKKKPKPKADVRIRLLREHPHNGVRIPKGAKLTIDEDAANRLIKVGAAELVDDKERFTNGSVTIKPPAEAMGGK